MQEISSSAGDSDELMDVVNMCDVLKEQEEMEMECKAVLGGSDPKNCSYSKGYIRQALYSCLTCVPETKSDVSKAAGICLACSFHCHDGHELIELFTKRHFRCDCGSYRQSRAKCNLAPIKTLPNTENQYNQNFSGIYCICQRPYPDPEDNFEDEMIQCVFCEDWYHRRHLQNAPSHDVDFYEMICGKCMDQYGFLSCYLSNTVGFTSIQTKQECIYDQNSCKKPEPMVREPNSSAFWSDKWREKLCQCTQCLSIYKKLNCEFLIDPEDPVQKYEASGSCSKGIYEESLKAFDLLEHAQKIEMIMGYNDLKEKLQCFFTQFAESKEVITKKHIQEFFEKINKNKTP